MARPESNTQAFITRSFATTADSVDGSPFPLAVTPFEHYMLADDSADHPMTVALRCHYTGSINRQRLMEATATALQAHPLLCAQIQGELHERTRRIFWRRAPVEPQILWVEEGEEQAFPRHLDLRKKSGLRIIVLEHAQAPCMIIQWHHACCDGAGILHFLESLVRAYRDGNTPTETHQAQLTRSKSWWKSRSRMNTQWYDDLKRLPHDLARIFHYFRTPTVSLAADANCQSFDPQTWSNDQYYAVTLSHAETAALQAAAKSWQVSLNDFLLAEYFRALLNWNTQRQHNLKSDSLRVAVPINLRPADFPKQDPAVNGVSMVFLDRNRAQIEADQLLPGITYEMTNVKRWRTGWAMIQSLAAAGCVRNGMKRLVSCGGPKVTSGLSNLGRIFANSDLANSAGKLQADTWVLDRVEPFPPVRPGVVAAVDAITYANQLTLTINYDRLQLTRASAQTLLDQFTLRLRSPHSPHGSL